MSRTEYMRELDALLQGISKEEREEAMQYYNDYFDDAGSENEEKVIEELGSPAKLAETCFTNPLKNLGTFLTTIVIIFTHSFYID